jgi:hypothetical protein
MNSASLWCLAGRYDNPIPTRCLDPIDFLKIPALIESSLELKRQRLIAKMYSKHLLYSGKRRNRNQITYNAVALLLSGYLFYVLLFLHINQTIRCEWLHHKLNNELDLQSLYGLQCTHWLRPRNSTPRI